MNIIREKYHFAITANVTSRFFNCCRL